MTGRRDGPARSQRQEHPQRRDIAREAPSPDPFGDVLPDHTGDEGAFGWGDGPDEREHDDERLRREVPPHHG